MARVPVIPAGADVVAAVDPPVPAPVIPPVVIPAPVAPVEAAPVVAPLAAPAPAQDPGPAPIQAVPEVADAQPIGVAALSVKIEALEKQVSADSGPGASVRAPGGGPARRALRWDSYCSGTRKSGRRV